MHPCGQTHTCVLCLRPQPVPKLNFVNYFFSIADAVEAMHIHVGDGEKNEDDDDVVFVASSVFCPFSSTRKISGFPTFFQRKNFFSLGKSEVQLFSHSLLRI